MPGGGETISFPFTSCMTWWQDWDDHFQHFQQLGTHMDKTKEFQTPESRE